VVQSVGTVMNLKWVTQGGVLAGPFCSAQGAITLPVSYPFSKLTCAVVQAALNRQATSAMHSGMDVYLKVAESCH
jgi:hypothetical protein